MTKNRKLKVYGTTEVVSKSIADAVGESGTRWQVRLIVAAPSQKAAARLMGIPHSRFRDWASETGNASDLEVALAAPGQVFARPTISITSAPVKVGRSADHPMLVLGVETDLDLDAAIRKAEATQKEAAQARQENRRAEVAAQAERRDRISQAARAAIDRNADALADLGHHPATVVVGSSATRGVSRIGVLLPAEVYGDLVQRLTAAENAMAALH